MLPSKLLPCCCQRKIKQEARQESFIGFNCENYEIVCGRKMFLVQSNSFSLVPSHRRLTIYYECLTSQINISMQINKGWQSVSLLSDFFQLTAHNSLGPRLHPGLLSKVWNPPRLAALKATRLHCAFNLKLQRTN